VCVCARTAGLTTDDVVTTFSEMSELAASAWSEESSGDWLPWTYRQDASTEANWHTKSDDTEDLFELRRFFARIIKLGCTGDETARTNGVKQQLSIDGAAAKPDNSKGKKSKSSANGQTQDYERLLSSDKDTASQKTLEWSAVGLSRSSSADHRMAADLEAARKKSGLQYSMFGDTDEPSESTESKKKKKNKKNTSRVRDMHECSLITTAILDCAQYSKGADMPLAAGMVGRKQGAPPRVNAVLLFASVNGALLYSAEQSKGDDSWTSDSDSRDEFALVKFDPNNGTATPSTVGEYSRFVFCASLGRRSPPSLCRIC
jgi:hypothetical protein